MEEFLKGINLQVDYIYTHEDFDSEKNQFSWEEEKFSRRRTIVIQTESRLCFQHLRSNNTFLIPSYQFQSDFFIKKLFIFLNETYLRQEEDITKVLKILRDYFQNMLFLE